MDITIGLSRAGLTKLANDILAECASTPEPFTVEWSRLIEHNGPGALLTLRLNNGDMENRDDVTADTAYWEQV
jgi:hypothetical protein